MLTPSLLDYCLLTVDPFSVRKSTASFWLIIRSLLLLWEDWKIVKKLYFVVKSPKYAAILLCLNQCSFWDKRYFVSWICDAGWYLLAGVRCWFLLIDTVRSHRCLAARNILFAFLVKKRVLWKSPFWSCCFDFEADNFCWCIRKEHFSFRYFVEWWLKSKSFRWIQPQHIFFHVFLFLLFFFGYFSLRFFL